MKKVGKAEEVYCTLYKYGNKDVKIVLNYIRKLNRINIRKTHTAASGNNVMELANCVKILVKDR